MKGYTEITNQEEMNALLERVGAFHDSMAKELHLMNRGFVDRDQSMIMTHRYDAQLLVQLQAELAAIELLFVGIEHITTDSPGECYEATGSVDSVNSHSEKTRITIDFDGTLNITAERLFVTDRPDWTGPRSRFGMEIPHPGCVPATKVDNQWRQCSACADAFEAPDDVVYYLCTGCGAMTELHE